MNATVEIGTLHPLDGDRMQVRQLFQNIIVNALKYRREDTDPAIRVVSKLLKGDVCEISVEDNGIGFDEKYLCRIFNPFERLHSRKRYDGTGIGLATCEKIVIRHGGEITSRSTPGKGSVFIVRLPVRHITNNI